jgi:hypothetical protein
VRSPVLESLKVIVDHRQVGQLGLAPRRMRELGQHRFKLTQKLLLHPDELVVRVLELQLNRYLRRIDFWYARQWELGAPLQIANRSRRGYSLVFDDRPADISYDAGT